MDGDPGASDYGASRRVGQLEERMSSDRLSVVERFEKAEKRITDLETKMKSLQSLRPVQDPNAVPADLRNLPPPVAKLLGKAGREPVPVPYQPPADVVGETPAEEGDVPSVPRGVQTFGTWKSRTWYLLYRGALSLLALLAAAVLYVFLPQQPPYRFFILGIVAVAIVNLILALLKKAPKGAKAVPHKRMVSDSESDSATTRVPDREATFRRLMKRGGGNSPEGKT